MKRRGWWGLMLWLLGLGLGTQPAEATLLVYRSVDQQIQDATRIVRGRVLSKVSFVYQGNGHIYTDVRIHVLEALKGSAEAELTVRQLGGTVGERTTFIAGAARFQIGEEVLLFLAKERQQGFLFLQDFGAGKYTIFLHEGRTLLRRSVEGLAFYRHANNPADRIRTSVMSERPLDLDTLRSRIFSIKQQHKPTLLSSPTQRFQERLQRARSSLQRAPHLQKLPTFQNLRHPLRSLHDQSTFKPAPLRTLQKQRLPSFVRPLRGNLVKQRIERKGSPKTTVQPSVQTPQQGGSR